MSKSVSVAALVHGPTIRRLQRPLTGRFTDNPNLDQPSGQRKWKVWGNMFRETYCFEAYASGGIKNPTARYVCD